MFSICFSRKCKQSTEVQADINTDLFCEKPVLAFSWECGHQYAASLLEQHLCEKMAASIERAHRLAYQRGWDDKKKKKRKATDFSGSFETQKDDVAW